MSRTTYLRERLQELAGPLGPLGTIEHRDRAKADWFEELSPDDAMILSEMTYAVDRGSDEAWVLSYALRAVGPTDLDRLHECVRRCFVTNGPHEVLLEALDVGDSSTVELLLELEARYDLDGRSRVALICSLGEIGTERAQDWLLKAKDDELVASDRAQVSEIQIALDMISRRT